MARGKGAVCGTARGERGGHWEGEGERGGHWDSEGRKGRSLGQRGAFFLDACVCSTQF